MRMPIIRHLQFAAWLCAAPLAIAGSGCGEHAPTDRVSASSDRATSVTVVTYAIEGMHCSGCADAIIAEVGEVKGVKGVQCTFESKRAVIELTDPAALGEAERAITKMGYKIGPAVAGDPAADASPTPAPPAPAAPTAQPPAAPSSK